MKVNVAHIEDFSYIYGPGSRFVIWMQGCSIRCPGCWNYSMWSFSENTLYDVEDLLKMIYERRESIEGVTLLGGEPLDQFSATLLIVSKIKSMGLSVMLFTGYTKEEVYTKRFSSILQYVDILISGRYIESLRTLTH